MQHILEEIEEPISQQTVDIKPMPGDPWLLASALQKAIRRGEVERAVMAAYSLWHQDKTRFWRRLHVTALEDVGVANTKLLCQVLAVTSSAVWRKRVGDLNTAIWLTIQLCRSDKIRIAEQAYTQAERATSYQSHRLRLASESDEYLSGIASNTQGDLVERTMALWLLAGTKRFASDYMPLRHGDLASATSTLQALDTPHDLTKTCMSVISRSPWPLSIITPLCWQAVQTQPKPLYVWLDPIPVVDDYRGMPLYACDMFTRIGKACIRDLQKTIRPLKHYSTEQIGLGVFYVEGGRLDKVLTSEWLEGFRQSAELADIENTGMILPEYLGFKELIAENMTALNSIRRDHLKKLLKGAR